MTGVFPPGHVLQLGPALPGRWQVWSKSSDAPGAYFFVPYDEESREQGVKYVVGRAIEKRGAAHPEITVIRIEKDVS